MCGGRGTRLDTATEKPLVPIRGTPMVERVCAALDASAVETVYAVTSPHAPETAEFLDIPCIEAPGDGYVADLDATLADERLSTPVLTVAADLPLLDDAAVDAVLAAHAGSESLTVVVPVGRKRTLGLSVDTRFRDCGCVVTPAGVNVVGDGADRTLRRRERAFAANVNRPGDITAVEWLLAGD